MTAEERHLATLARAYGRLHHMGPDCAVPRMSARAEYDGLRAAAKALYPGRQKNKHVEAALKLMVPAVARVVRRRARS